MSGEDSSVRKEGENPKNGKAAKHKEKRYWRAVRIGAFFGVIEVLSLVLWVKSEDFDLDAARHIRWVAACGFLAGGAYLAHKFTSENRKKRMIQVVWVGWGLACLGLLLLKPERSKPHLQLGFKIAGEKGWPLMLTNYYFIASNKMIKTNQIAVNEVDFDGVVFVPVHFGVTNVSIVFSLFNDSEAPLRDWCLKCGVPNINAVRPSDSWGETGLDEEPTRRALGGGRMPSLAPSDFFLMPEISFNPHLKPTIPVSFLTWGQNMSPVLWGVVLHFEEMDFPGKAFVSHAHTTNNSGKVSGDLPVWWHWETNTEGVRVLQGEGTQD